MIPAVMPYLPIFFLFFSIILSLKENYNGFFEESWCFHFQGLRGILARTLIKLSDMQAVNSIMSV